MYMDANKSADKSSIFIYTYIKTDHYPTVLKIFLFREVRFRRGIRRHYVLPQIRTYKYFLCKIGSFACLK